MSVRKRISTPALLTALLIVIQLVPHLAAQSFSADPPHAPLFAFEKVVHAEKDRRERCPYYITLSGDWSAIIQRFDANGAPSAAPADRVTLRDNPLAGWWISPQFGCRTESPGATSQNANPRANAEIAIFGRNVTIPDDWAGRNMFLRLEAANAKLAIKVDQSPLLEIPASAEPVDLNVTTLFRPGPHQLQVSIEKRLDPATGAGMFNQSWQYVGLIDAPYLYSPPTVQLLDHSAKTIRDEATGADLVEMTVTIRNLSNAAPPPLKLEAYLFDDSGHRVFNRILAMKIDTAPGQTSTHTLQQRIPNPHRSTPAAPYRYSLLFALVGEGDRPTQVERLPIEFR